MKVTYLGGIQWHPFLETAPMVRLRAAAAEEAERMGFDHLVWTSLYRPGSAPSLHARGRAIDAQAFHGGRLIAISEGHEWAARTQASVGYRYDVFWHEGSAWHLHGEYEEGRDAPTAGFYRRVQLTKNLTRGTAA